MKQRVIMELDNSIVLTLAGTNVYGKILGLLVHLLTILQLCYRQMWLWLAGHLINYVTVTVGIPSGTNPLGPTLLVGGLTHSPGP
ncbi:hypothetical protein GQ457_18G020000 [Hibiscus cannabinus]